jgi:hypothetical protein
MCPVPARAGANLVEHQAVSGLDVDDDAAAVVVALPAFVRRIGGASPY